MEKEQLENIVDTLKDNQIEEVISVLKDRDIWFTSKNDPTYTEPSSYYTLDEYGCPTEKAMEDILKDCNDYVGDGALDFTEAIDMWVEKCLADGKLAYIDYLVTTYKTKPVVDNIEAYEVKEIKTESKIEESEFTNEDLLNNFTQYVANNAVELKNGLYEIEVPKELGYQPVLNTDMLKKAYMKVKKLFNLDNGDTSIIFENKETNKKDVVVEGNISLNNLNREQSRLLDKELEDVLYILNKYSSDVNFKRAKVNIKISGDLNYDNSLDSDSKEAIQQKKVNFENFVNDMKANGYKDYGGTQDFNTHVIPFNNTSGNAFVSLTKKLKDININVRFIMFVYGKTYNIDMKVKVKNTKTESVKTRLREENNKSLELIGQMLQQDDFDANSNEGKIVVKTSELFNKLSDKGFDVQVNFDNGDSQSTILLSKQGGSVNITINNANDPLRAYTSGSFEVNNDTLQVLEDVQDVLNELN